MGYYRKIKNQSTLAGGVAALIIAAAFVIFTICIARGFLFRFGEALYTGAPARNFNVVLWGLGIGTPVVLIGAGVLIGALAAGRIAIRRALLISLVLLGGSGFAYLGAGLFYHYEASRPGSEAQYHPYLQAPRVPRSLEQRDALILFAGGSGQLKNHRRKTAENSR